MSTKERHPGLPRPCTAPNCLAFAPNPSDVAGGNGAIIHYRAQKGRCLDLDMSLEAALGLHGGKVWRCLETAWSC